MKSSVIADRGAATKVSQRPFVKMHGLLNHFVIVDGRETAFKPSREDIIRICDGRVGVGADELCVIENPTDDGAAARAYAFMRIYNIDGTEVGACGNATRCVAYLLLEESGGDRILLETAAGILECRRAGDFMVSVNMGRITTDWEAIPTTHAVDTLHVDVESGPLHDATVLHIGNPHAVFFVDDLSSVDMERLAPVIQEHPLFPEGINVGVAEISSESALRLSVWERPGMLTTACGSGACVAVYAARLRGLTEARRMTVEMPAGLLQVEINDDHTATMTGPVAFCFQGTL